METEQTGWKSIEKITFRFFFVFFVLQILPLNWKYFGSSLSGKVLPDFFNIFSWTNYTPTFISQQDQVQLSDLLVIVIISLLISAYWTWRQKEIKEYNFLYQLLRVVLRYRLAAALLVYAFIKIFPMQLPFPTLSDLNTDYGDLLPSKIFELTVGSAKAYYQSAIGMTELFAGILLLFRRTATLGAFVAAGVLLNIVLSNFAYHIGDQSYSLYLFVIAVFLFSYDIPRIYRLLLEKPVIANKTVLILNHQWQKKTRIILKIAFILLVLVYAAGTYLNYNSHPYFIPQSKGLKDAYGFYNVKEFKINNKTIPYAKSNPDRWQDVVFEKWGTLSINIAKPIQIDRSRHGVNNLEDIDRTFESSGTAGRHYYAYRADTVQHILYLQNKNQHYRNEKMILHYTRPNPGIIVISGVTQSRDSIYAVLTKLDKKYLLLEGRRKPIKL